MGNALLICLFTILYILLNISGDKTNEINRINYLSETTEIQNDYSSVKRNCDEIIRLSSKIGRIDYMLLGYYTLCWSAEIHGEIEDLHDYVNNGMKLLNKNFSKLASSDTGRMIMSSMIHASGQYHYTLGDYQRAIEDFQKIVPNGSDPLTRDSSILSAVYNYIGQSYFNSGLLDRSIPYFELAYRYNSSMDDFTYSEALYLMYKAQYEYSTGEKEKAFNSLDEAIPLLVNDPRKSYVRNALKSVYLLYASFCKTENNYDSAISFIKKSMDLFSENDPDFINGYRLLGDIYYSTSRHDSALICYYHSIEFSDRIFSDMHYSRARSLCGIANIMRDNNNFGRALHYYGKSMDNVSSPLESMNVKLEEARLYKYWFEKSNKNEILDSGLHLLQSALFLNDLCRREQFNHEAKESRSVMQAEISELGTEMALEGYERSGNQGYLEKCFHFMEKNKGNILLDKVYELNARHYSNIPQSILEKERRLREEVSYFRGLLNSGMQNPDNNIKSKYDDKQIEYFNLVSELERKYSRYYRLKYENESVTISQLQKQLKNNDELIILYYITGNRIYIAGVSKYRSVLKTTEKNEAFDHHLAGFVDQMDINKISESLADTALLAGFIESSQYLYLQLIQPVLKEFEKPVRKLTLVPDGVLCYLPFEALITSDVDSRRNFGNLPYLITKYRISYEYSASMIYTHAGKTGSPNTRYLGFAPDYEITTDLPSGKSSLVSLPSVRDEIESCRNIWKGNAFVGKKATEANFISHVNRYDIIHMALHAVISDDDPRSSCLVFEKSPGQSRESELFINELYDMELNPELIILSGCETGGGRFKNGEGIISLARAFRYAGCRSLLMSLWKINDKSSRDVMVLFNRYLKRGMDKSAALQKAKTEYIKKYSNNHPAYWAAFVIIGDANPLNRQYRIPLAVSLILLSAILTYIIIRKMRNANTRIGS